MANIRNTVNGGAGEPANSQAKQRMAQNMRRALREGQQSSSPPPRPQSSSITRGRSGSSKPTTPSGGGTSQSITRKPGRG